MKTGRLLTAVLASLLVLALASPALAQARPRMGAGPGPHHPGGPAMGDQLTPAQQQTMQKIMNAHQEAFSKLGQRLWAKQVQLQAALTEDKIDEARIKSLANDINRLRSDLFNEQVMMQVELSRAGLAYHTMHGRGMGFGMMGGGMMGSCPMMGGGIPAGPGNNP